MAKQAAGSAVVQFGETMVIAAVTVSDNESPLPFFPLLVEYKEKAVPPIPKSSRRESSTDRFVRSFLKDSRTRSRSSSTSFLPTRKTTPT